MLKSILIFGAKAAILLTKSLGRLMLVIAFYLFKVLGWLMRLAEQLSLAGCVAAGVFKPIENDSVKAPEFEQKFTEEDIDEMVEELGGKRMTIQEIQQRLGVSYRQARKIAKAAEKSLRDHHFAEKMAVA